MSWRAGGLGRGQFHRNNLNLRTIFQLMPKAAECGNQMSTLDPHNQFPCPLYGQEQTWQKLKDLCKSDIHGSHLFITGSSGSGKTTMVREFLKMYAYFHAHDNWKQWGVQSNEDCLLLNSDQDRGIQTIRNNVSLFIRQIGKPHSLTRHRWLVIDDCDMFPQISQQALRRPMETYSHITRFIFIGTSIDDLIPALQSRCIQIPMQTINFFDHVPHILKSIDMPFSSQISIEMLYTIMNICNNNFSDFLRYLRLLRNYCIHNNSPPTQAIINKLCSVPYYNLFIPLVNSICELNTLESCLAIIKIWKKGYTFEDILDNFHQIYILYGASGNNKLNNNLIIKAFLINAWLDFCKGNTSILALQNVVVRTIKEASQMTDKLNRVLPEA